MKIGWIGQLNIAHRGLHTKTSAAPENSLQAASAAIAAGVAIEVDVQLTRDDHVVVFHDDRTERMTGIPGNVADMTLAELKSLPLGDAGISIPSLKELADLVAGAVPLYIEIKCFSKLRLRRLCSGVRHALEGYPGDVAIMSFDSDVVAWFNRFEPSIPRGWVLGRKTLLNLMTRLTMPFRLARLRPHFLACDINLLPNPVCSRFRRNTGPVLTWTVRSPEQEKIGQQHADALIFERPAVLKAAQ